jgi:peptidoglycan hydrolase CwlO-like protein
MTRKTALSALLIVLLVFFQFLAGAFAYDDANDGNLERSHDALLSQRDHLQQEAAQISRQIDSLQQRLQAINDSLRDNDAALRDVERALRR